MNAWKIALFIFLVQSGLYLTTLANIPLTCTSDGTSCIYFSTSTLRSTDMGAIITSEIDNSLFSSPQINENLFNLDTLNFMAKAIAIVTEFVYMSVFGLSQIILFAFGSGAVSIAFAAIVQVIVFYFYGRLLVDQLRPGSRGEI